MLKRHQTTGQIIAGLAAMGTSVVGPNLDPAFRGQQSGEFVRRKRSILREPGATTAYFPGQHGPGTKVKFRRGVYVVCPAGNLRRVVT
jgi:hypothetical protein